MKTSCNRVPQDARCVIFLHKGVSIGMGMTGMKDTLVAGEALNKQVSAGLSEKVNLPQGRPSPPFSAGKHRNYHDKLVVNLAIK